MNVTEDFLDVLHNIEFIISVIYKANPAIGDKDVILATERLIGTYTREKKGLPILPVPLPVNSLILYEAMKAACEVRLTRESNDIVHHETDAYQIPLRLMIICLERLHKSMMLWHKKDGFRGYLNFMVGYVG